MDVPLNVNRVEMNKKLWRKDFFLPKNVLRYCIDVIKVTLGGYLKYAQIVCA